VRLSRSTLTSALICQATFAVCAPRASSAGDLLAPCDRCDVLVGVGATFRYYGSYAWTGGLVVHVTLELADSRWELGAFRFATAQPAPASALPATSRAANPYWGFTATRRWQVLHRRWGRLYVGFGANYRTEVDYLEATRWNFAYLIAARFDIDAHHRAVELGVRHWSDAWIRPPNRGQNLLTLSFAF
jgi:hypothetical protein